VHRRHLSAQTEIDEPDVAAVVHDHILRLEVSKQARHARGKRWTR
jgi:hypothetical protein